jgi:hypothetical protein
MLDLPPPVGRDTMIRFPFDLSIAAATCVLLPVLLPSPVCAQDPPPVPAPLLQPSLPPATKLEAFLPVTGSVLTVGFDELGRVQGVSVDAREIRDSHGTFARGVVVRVIEEDRHQEVSFVDEDEIPDLLKGFDALLDVRANPTTFRNFEVQYATHGELVLTAFNTPGGNVLFAVQAGRPLKARRSGLSTADMLRLRGMFETAAQKLNVR